MCSGKEDAGDEGEDLLQDGACFVVRGREVYPAQRGYTAVYNYALYFWRPYLGGTAFDLWELLLSFCYGDTDTVYPSISRLARMLSNSERSRRVITGRNRAAGAGDGTLRTYRGDGALDVLLRERLVQIRRDGEGHLSSYTFRVCRALPLLRPEQVARLCPSLQRDHARWLQRYGIDPAAYREAFESSVPVEPIPHHAQKEDPVKPISAPAPVRRCAGRTGGPARPSTPAHADSVGRTGSPAKPSTRAHAPPVGLAASPANPVAPGTSPAARGRISPVPGAPGGGAPGTSPAAPGTTNHPQEVSLPNQWWQQTLKQLRHQMRRVTYETSLPHLKLQSFRDGVLTLKAPTPNVREVVQFRLAEVLQETLHDISGGQVVRVEVE